MSIYLAEARYMKGFYYISLPLGLLKEIRGLGMIIPVRCFSCGKVIGDRWEEFARRVSRGENPGAVLDDLGITRYCCRRMLLSHVELIDEILRFYMERRAQGCLEESRVGTSRG